MNVRFFLLALFFLPVILFAGNFKSPVIGNLYLKDGFQYDTFYYTMTGYPIFVKQLYDQAAVPAGLTENHYKSLASKGMLEVRNDFILRTDTINVVSIKNLASNRAEWLNFKNSMTAKGIPVWPVVTSHAKYPFILNGEILIEFYKWTSKDKIDALLNEYGLELIEEKMMNSHFIKAKLPLGSDPFQIANTIYETGLVYWAQPNWYRVLIPYAEPNDTYYQSGKQDWYLNMMNVPAAWSINEGNPDIKVGVVDSGVWYDHEDLAANIDPISPIDGYYYDYLGKVTTGGWGGNPKGGSPDNDPRPELINTGDTYNDNAGMAHGTACSGIIAGVGNNGKGITGVCQKCKIIPIRLIGAQTQMSQEDAQYDAIMMAVSKGAGVINNSYGRATKNQAGQCTNNFDNTAVSAVNQAKLQGRGGKGTITVWAAGNDTCPTNTTPQYSNNDFVVVSALESNGGIASYSNYGTEVDVAAPAASVTTDIPGSDGMTKLGMDSGVTDSYTTAFNGTSAAAPATSGAIALMLSANPEMNFQAAVSCLKNAAKKTSKYCSFDQSKWVSQSDPYVQGGSKEHSQCYGFGTVDAGAMVAGAKDGSCSSACIATAKIDLCYGAGYQKDDDCSDEIDESCDKGGEGRTASACTTDDECGNTAATPFCKTDWPGGYCTAKCTTNADCYNKNSNRCQGGECVAVCAFNDIREGYGCVSGVIVPSTAPTAVCGNSTVETGETCDKNTKACSAIDAGYTSGDATCKADCKGWDLASCVGTTEEPVCGNGKIESPEICDGNKTPCNALLPEKPVGEATCNSDCKAWDTTSCAAQTTESVCGNGKVETGEECDDGNGFNDDGCDTACKKELVTPPADADNSPDTDPAPTTDNDSADTTTDTQGGTKSEDSGCGCSIIF